MHYSVYSTIYKRTVQHFEKYAYSLLCSELDEKLDTTSVAS